MWHIMKKLSEKVGAVVANNKDFIDPFLKCVWNSNSTEEFESEWNRVIKVNKLEECAWLKDLYSNRHMWIPAYFKDVFLAGIRTTQRSEAMNAFMDRFV